MSGLLRHKHAFFAFVRAIDLSNPLGSEKLRDAVRYALNQEACLQRFLEDGIVSIDNAACERSVKPVAFSNKDSKFEYPGIEQEIIYIYG